MIHDALHLVGIGHEVARQIATVELHSLDHSDVSVAALRLFNGDNTVLAYLAESLSQQLTNLRVVVGADGSHLLNLVIVVVHLLGVLLDIVNDCSNSLVDTTLQVHRVGTGGDVLQTDVDDALGQDGSRCRTVAGIVARLRGNALQQLSTCILELVLQLNLLSHGDTVLRNLRSTKLLLNNHVTSLRAECYLHCICQLIHAVLQQVAGIHIEFNIFCHNFLNS